MRRLTVPLLIGRFRRMSDKKYDQNLITLALVRYAGVNPRTFDLLLRTFRSLDEILLSEESEIAEIEGISAAAARRISKIDRHMDKTAGYYKKLAQRDIAIVTRFDDTYPPHLLEINDPPPLLYCRGVMPDVNSKIIGLVGAETATQTGIALTAKLAKALVLKNVQIISSIKQGIDTAVHIAGKAAGGRSFAILDKGFDHIEGEAEIPLVIDIVQTGGAISEFPPEEPFHERNFQPSNRLIAGLAQAVVITEFYENSVRVHDILEYSNQIGKLCFILIDPEYGLPADEKSLALAVKHGAVLLTGLEKIDDIIKSLV